MSISLADALEQVELEPGRTYECEVRGQQVELRVLAKPTSTAPAVRNQYATTPGLHPDDIRLDAWCELPSPKPLSRVIPRPIARHPFDIPEIPHEDLE